MSKLDFFFKNAFLGHIWKNQHIHFLVHGHFFLVYIQFTPSEGPRLSKMIFLRSQTMVVGPWARTTEKGPLSCSDFMLHSVNQPYEHVTITLQALSLVEKAKRSKFASHYALRDQRNMCMQDGCRVYMDPYMASNGSCFMVTWTISKTTSWR